MQPAPGKSLTILRSRSSVSGQVSIMEDFDATITDTDVCGEEQESARDRIWEFLSRLIKKAILFVSFGPGILGVAWLLGKIFKR